ncbi:MAG: hypothetical protein QM572_00475 [Nocardioides sp.]
MVWVIVVLMALLIALIVCLALWPASKPKPGPIAERLRDGDTPSGEED